MNCWPPSLGASLLAVCATACHPLPVCLDLHCAPGEAVGVKQHVTRLCLDLLPVVSTGGRCAHKETFKYIYTNNNNNLQLTNKQLMIIRAGDANRLALWLAAHWTPFKLWWRNYASWIILSTVCTTYWTGGVFSSDSFSCAAVRTDAGNLAVSLDIATHLSEQYTNMTRLSIDKLKNLSQRWGVWQQQLAAFFVNPGFLLLALGMLTSH